MREVLLALPLVLLAVSPATAKYNGPKIDVADYRGTFCGYTAQFHLDQADTAKLPKRHAFYGNITFTGFPGSNRLWIEQYKDGSLRIIRYLEGANAGQIQLVNTFTGWHDSNGWRWEGEEFNGPDCEGKADNTTILHY
jgi:hypothetical protein